MKKIKKALIGTALAGTLVVGAGAGTYSWFNAEANASGDIANHTFELNNGNAEKTLFTKNQKLAPGSGEVSDTFTIKNTGSMEQILRAGLDLQIRDQEGNVLDLDKSYYSINTEFNYKGADGTTHTYTIEKDASVIDEYFAGDKWFPDASGYEGQTFHPGDELSATFTVKLKTGADNEFQGKVLWGEIEVDARQNVENSSFE